MTQCMTQCMTGMIVCQICLQTVTKIKIFREGLQTKEYNFTFIYSRYLMVHLVKCVDRFLSVKTPSPNIVQHYFASM